MKFSLMSIDAMLFIHYYQHVLIFQYWYLQKTVSRVLLSPTSFSHILTFPIFLCRSLEIHSLLFPLLFSFSFFPFIILSLPTLFSFSSSFFLSFSFYSFPLPVFFSLSVAVSTFLTSWKRLPVSKIFTCINTLYQSRVFRSK